MASRSSNKAAVPEAKGRTRQVQVRGSNRAGSTVDDGYNGDLTSKQNGSVG